MEFKGEEIQAVATLLNTPIVTIDCFRKLPDCTFKLDVYAHLTDASEIANDKSDFYYYGDGTIDDLTISLEKNSNNCGEEGWEKAGSLSDNTLGKHFSYGKNPDFSNNDFIDDYGKKYAGCLLDWRKVLVASGTGRYRIAIKKTDVFGGIEITYDNRLFCLHTYNCQVTDKTVRIETRNEGLRGTFGDNLLTDYAGGWYGQIRLKGLFKYLKSGYVTEFNQYGETNFNAYKPYINEQKPDFLLALKPIPGWMQWYISTYVLQADEIKITDFNGTNPMKLNKVPVINSGDFTPKDNNFSNPVQGVEINLQYGLNNLRKRNSQ